MKRFVVCLVSMSSKLCSLSLVIVVDFTLFHSLFFSYCKIYSISKASAVCVRSKSRSTESKRNKTQNERRRNERMKWDKEENKKKAEKTRIKTMEKKPNANSNLQSNKMEFNFLPKFTLLDFIDILFGSISITSRSWCGCACVCLNRLCYRIFASFSIPFFFFFLLTVQCDLNPFRYWSNFDVFGWWKANFFYLQSRRQTTNYVWNWQHTRST